MRLRLAPLNRVRPSQAAGFSAAGFAAGASVFAVELSLLLSEVLEALLVLAVEPDESLEVSDLVVLPDLA